MKFETWIDEENLFPVLTAIGWLCDYKFNDDDEKAFKVGLLNVDEVKNHWFEYQLKNKGEINIALTMESGSSNYTIRIETVMNIEQGIKMITGIAQCYKICGF